MNLKPPSKANVIHWLLYAAVGLLVIGIGVSAVVLHQNLGAYVTQVDHLKIDAEIDERGIENAALLRQKLRDNSDSVERAAAIVADTTFYQYQDQIVQDVTSYGKAAGIDVLGFDFSSSATAAAKPSTVSGLKTVTTTVTLKNPVNYRSYLRFLKLLERNLTKLQVTQIDIASDIKTPGVITAPTVTLEVYVR